MELTSIGEIGSGKHVDAFLKGFSQQQLIVLSIYMILVSWHPFPIDRKNTCLALNPMSTVFSSYVNFEGTFWSVYIYLDDPVHPLP